MCWQKEGPDRGVMTLQKLQTVDPIDSAHKLRLNSSLSATEAEPFIGAQIALTEKCFNIQLKQKLAHEVIMTSQFSYYVVYLRDEATSFSSCNVKSPSPSELLLQAR
jgi:hypothetical protein